MSIKAADIPPSQILRTMSASAQQQAQAAQESALAKAQAKVVEVAPEFLDNAGLNEERRKKRAEKAERLIEITKRGEFIPRDEQTTLFSELKRDTQVLDDNMKKLDYSPLKDDDVAALYSDFIENKGDDKDLEEILKQLKAVVPDSDLYDKIYALIDNVDKSYVQPYQKVAEVLADIYAAFSELNTALSRMISDGKVNADKNTIEIDVLEFAAALQTLRELLFSQDSLVVQKLKAITFSAADIGKANELVQGSGLEVAGGPEIYYLVVSPTAFNNLEKAFAPLKPVLFPATTKTTVTTYQLQSFQTAFNSVNETLSGEMQTAAEKYRRTITQNDSFLKLLSSFMASNLEANKSFLT